MYISPYFEDWRWAGSLVSAATLNASANYLIENTARQSDQGNFPWIIADHITTFPRPARIVTYADNSRGADGFYAFQIGLPYATELMLAYVDYLFGFSDTVWSGDGTFKVRQVNGSFGVYQGLIYRPIPGEDMKRGQRGMEDVVLRIVNGVKVG